MWCLHLFNGLLRCNLPTGSPPMRRELYFLSEQCNNATINHRPRDCLVEGNCPTRSPNHLGKTGATSVPYVAFGSRRGIPSLCHDSDFAGDVPAGSVTCRNKALRCALGTSTISALGDRALSLAAVSQLIMANSAACIKLTRASSQTWN